MTHIRIVSGGQTGVDRAALDVARALGLSCGGWCPRGRKAEDGMIDSRYPLVETPELDYGVRTAFNVRDSDGTLVLTSGAPTGGTAHTIHCAKGAGKPYLVVDLERPIAPDEIVRWIGREQIRSLNVAGPRASRVPGIYEQASAHLSQVLSQFIAQGSSR